MHECRRQGVRGVIAGGAAQNTKARSGRAQWIAPALTAAAVLLVAGVSSADPPKPKTVPRMVQIPGGKFKMGSPPGGNMDEVPQHEVTVAAFQLDVTPVTVAAYRDCVDASVCREALSVPMGGGSGFTGCNWEVKDGSKDNHPVNCLLYSDAETYCKWVGKRLPTEEEWEYAAKGGDENRKYPWGGMDPERDKPKDSNIQSPHGCWFGWTSRSTCAVGSYPEAWNGKWGLVDMTGNISQWTSSGYSFDYNKPRDARAHTVRGGSHGGAEFNLRSARRFHHSFEDKGPPATPKPPGNDYDYLGVGPFHDTMTGVRCAK